MRLRPLRLDVSFLAGVRGSRRVWGNPDEATVKLIKASEKMWLDADCSQQPGLKNVFADDFQGTYVGGERYGKKGCDDHA